MKSSDIFNRSIATILSLCFLQWSCNVNKGEEIKNINGVIVKLIEADNNSNITAILNSYTDSIEFYPPGGQFIKGIENVKRSYEKLFQENKLDLQTQITETKVFYDHATVTGINTGTKMNLKDSVITSINDRYLAVLLYNDKAGWKINKLAWCKN